MEDANTGGPRAFHEAGAGNILTAENRMLKCAVRALLPDPAGISTVVATDWLRHRTKSGGWSASRRMRLAFFFGKSSLGPVSGW